MTMFKSLPLPMIRDIDLFLEQNRSKCIELYVEAERIRLKWEGQNVALEDVANVLVERCGAHGVALSFDRLAEAEVLLELPDEPAQPRRTG